MATVNETFVTLKSLWDAFEVDHNKFSEKSNASAGARARKSLGAVKKLVTQYRKESVEAVRTAKG